MGENFGLFLGVMFVFGLILTILRAQTRKLAKKGGKNVQKSDEKVRKITFLYGKNTKTYGFSTKVIFKLARLCENLDT